MYDKELTMQQITREDIERHIISKAWPDDVFREELLNDPKTVLARELNIQFPDELEIVVVEENTDRVYLTLPAKPREDIVGPALMSRGFAALAPGDLEQPPLDIGEAGLTGVFCPDTMACWSE
jgi:hypothetical protein